MLLKAKNVILLRKNHSARMITPGEVFEVDEGTAKRYLETNAAVKAVSGLAETAGKAPLTANHNGNTPKGKKGQEGPKTGENVKGHLDGTDLEGMSFADLKALAKDMGIDTGKIRSKSGMIEAITSVEVEAPLTEDDDLPDLTPQEVIEE